jgi:hypothetical protein
MDERAKSLPDFEQPFLLQGMDCLADGHAADQGTVRARRAGGSLSNT